MEPEGALFDYSRAFVKVPRDLLRILFSDAPSLQVYLAILDRARYAPGSESRGERGIFELETGEAVFGRADLASILRLSESQVRTAVARLVQLSVIAIRTTKRGTVVKVIGYGEIQLSDSVQAPSDSPTDNQQIANRSPPVDQQIANRQPTDRQQIATNKTEDVRRETEDVRRENGAPLARGSRTRIPKPPEIPIPADWTPTSEHSELARERGVDLALQARTFRAHAESHDRKAVRWNAAFTQWLLKSQPSRASPDPRIGRIEPQSPELYKTGEIEL